MGQDLSPRKEVKDRPAQTPNVVFVFVFVWEWSLFTFLPLF